MISPAMGEQTADLERRLAHLCGDCVEVEYMGVSSTPIHEFPLARWTVFVVGLSLPVVAFDGQPRIAGIISIEMISQSRSNIHSQPPGFTYDCSGRGLLPPGPRPAGV